MTAPLRLSDIAAAMPGRGQGHASLFDIAARLHRQAGYVRRGLLRLAALGLAERDEKLGLIPVYTLLDFDVARHDEIVPPPDTGPKTGSAATAGTSPDVLSGKFAKPVDPIVLPPRALADLQLDEALIAAMRGIFFDDAFEAAKVAGEESNGRIPPIVAIAIQERALRDAADMCRRRIEAALSKKKATA